MNLEPVYVFTIEREGVVHSLRVAGVEGMEFAPTPPDRAIVDLDPPGTIHRCQAIIGSAVLPVWAFASGEK